jgi:hypothetical protein
MPVKLVDHFLRQAALPESLVVHQREDLHRVGMLPVGRIFLDLGGG